MRTRGRPILGLVSGLLWGAGAAVLINMYGLSALSPLLVYGMTGGAAALSWAWSRRGGRRTSGLPLLVLAVLLPGNLLAQEGACEVWVDPGDTALNWTSPSDPIVIDPDDEDPITVVVWSPEFVEDRNAEIWLEIGGVPVPLRSGPITGNEFIRRFDPDELLTPFGVLPGLHHVGGSIDGVCEVDGYVRVLGNPLSNPLGQAAVALVVVGLGGTLIAGRSPRPAPTRPAPPEPTMQPPAGPPPEPAAPPEPRPAAPPRLPPSLNRPLNRRGRRSHHPPRKHHPNPPASNRHPCRSRPAGFKLASSPKAQRNAGHSLTSAPTPVTTSRCGSVPRRSGGWPAPPPSPKSSCPEQGHTG